MATPFSTTPFTFVDVSTVSPLVASLLSGAKLTGPVTWSAVNEGSVFIPGYGLESQDFTILDVQPAIEPPDPADPSGDPDEVPAPAPIATTNEKAAVAAAFAAWANVSGLAVTQVVETETNVGDIRVGKSPLPTHTNELDFHPRGGDVWFSEGFNPGAGTIDTAEQLTILRETGQALGLKNFFEQTLFNEQTLEEGGFNSQTWSIYGAGNGGAVGVAQGPQYLDILAMQALYGVETTTGAGNSTYIVGAGNKTIVDVSGVDTFQLASTGTIDLRGVDLDAINAHASTVAGGQLIIGPQTVIENGVGSAGADTIWGNDFINDLKGNAGNDIINGLGSGDRIQGGDGADRIDAGTGNDTVFGQRGVDTITLGAGKDTLVFNTRVATAEADVVRDFRPVDDTFNVDNAVFTKAGANGKLAAAAFYQDNVGGPAAHDATDRFIYSKTNGQLWYDDDGTGSHAAQLVARLTPGLTLSAADFLVI